jgi:hypothetical protein
VKTYVDGQIAATNELSEVLAAGNTTGANDIDVENAQKVQFRDAAIYINSSVDGQLDIVADTEIQIAATTVDLNGNLDVSGTTVSAGKITADAGIDIDNINIDGTTIALSSGDLTLDVAGDIILDADGGDVILKDAGSDRGRFDVSDNFIIKSQVSDKDIIFQGNDAGIGIITALTLDMSASGRATFNNNVVVTDGNAFVAGNSDDFQIYHSSDQNVIQAVTSDQDIVFKGSDGGSAITALTLDMSAAGAATFNGSVLVPNKIEHVGDADTYLQFSADDWRVVTGNLERFSVNNSAVVVNEESDDLDFRVESNGNANMLFVDGGNNSVSIGTSVNLGGTLNLYDGSFRGQAAGALTATMMKPTAFGYSPGAYAVTMLGAPNTSGTVSIGYDPSGNLSGAFGGSGTEMLFGGNMYFTQPNATDDGWVNQIRMENQTGVTINEDSEDLDFRVESNGNANMLFVDGGADLVGIGTGSPIALDGNAAPGLTISSNGPFICLQDANNADKVNYISNNTGVMQFGIVGDNGATGKTEVANFSSVGAIFNDGGLAANDFRVESDTNAQALFVDAGGNFVAMGNTTKIPVSGFSDQHGFGFDALTGSTQIASDGIPLEIGRTTTGGSNGLFIQMREQSNVVGAIGNYNGVPYIGYGGGTGGGIMFNGRSIEPTGLGATRTDDANDIGSSTYRWKDAYLAGGVFLGGTVAANLLDDYEEGTWTPVIAGSQGGAYTYTAAATARYTRVGNLVTLSAAITNITTSGGGHTGYVQIQGAPFNKDSSTFATGAIELSSGDMSSGQTYATVSFITASSTTVMYIRQLGDNSAGADFPVSGINSGTTDFNFTITYQTA